MTTHENRRRYPRVSYPHYVGLLFDAKYQVAQGYEIGEGGVSFFSSVPLPLATRILVTIPVKVGQFKCIQAEVRNCLTREDGHFMVGVQFLDINFDIKRGIRSFVSSGVF